jgi:hypothetical protein
LPNSGRCARGTLLKNPQKPRQNEVGGNKTPFSGSFFSPPRSTRPNLERVTCNIAHTVSSQVLTTQPVTPKTQLLLEPGVQTIANCYRHNGYVKGYTLGCNLPSKRVPADGFHLEHPDSACETFHRYFSGLPKLSSCQRASEPQSAFPFNKVARTFRPSYSEQYIPKVDFCQQSSARILE